MLRRSIRQRGSAHTPNAWCCSARILAVMGVLAPLLTFQLKLSANSPPSRTRRTENQSFWAEIQLFAT
jgi:hypothetical protein